MSLESPREIFEVHFPKRLETKPELVGQIDSCFKFVLTGDDASTWTVDLTAAPGRIAEADEEAQCTITVKSSDFLDIATGKLNGQTAFMTGKLKVSGDMGRAMKLGMLFRD